MVPMLVEYDYGASSTVCVEREHYDKMCHASYHNVIFLETVEANFAIPATESAAQWYTTMFAGATCHFLEFKMNESLRLQCFLLLCCDFILTPNGSSRK